LSMKGTLRVIFRTGGGRGIGLGHVRRCLSLAEALRSLGVECIFLLDGDQAAVALATAADFEVVRIYPEEDIVCTTRQIHERRAHVVVADSYDFQSEYFRGLNSSGAAVVAIDDLVNRELPVHLVINGSAGAGKLEYRASKDTLYLLGPQFALLRSEFAEEPKRRPAGPVEQVLITVGGGDPMNLTPRLVDWTVGTLGDVLVDVVIGPLFESPDSIERYWRGASRITFHHHPEEMHSLMLASDLALCSGGQTTYELAASGIPAIAVRLAENQTPNLMGLAAIGALMWVGDAHDKDLEAKVRNSLAALGGDAVRRRRMSECGRAHVDGQGALRVARVILDLSGGLLP